MAHFGRSTLVALACLAAPAPAFADMIFSDSTFNLGTYSTGYLFNSVPGDTITYSQCATCGNPGMALDIHVTEPNGGVVNGVPPNTQTVVQIGIVNSAFSYNPLTQGAIATITASVDKNITDNAVGTVGNSFRPMIEQDGKFYAAAISGPTLTSPGSTGYNTLSAAGLTASDFLQVDPTTGVFGTANPNFAGDTILFGLIQNFGANEVANTVVDFDYDNLSIDVKAAVAAVPEPGSLPALLTGIGVLFGLARLRRMGFFRG